MHPAYSKLIVRKGRLNETTKGGVALPSNLKANAAVGLVIEVGKEVKRFDYEAEVVLFNGYQQSAAWDDLDSRDDIVVIDECAVLATFTQAEAEARFNVTFEPKE